MLLIAMNPTRGLDVGTSHLVQERLLDWKARGGAVLLISEDLDELLQFSEGLIVMYRGQIAGRFDRPEFDAYRICALMTGVVDPPDRSPVAAARIGGN